MATPAQTRANRANSAKSSGPKTQTGKKASSRNRTSHGLAQHHNGIFYFLPDEDRARFMALAEELIQEHLPATKTELLLVGQMADHEWLRVRALRLQQTCLFENQHVIATTQFALYMRYETIHQRAFYKALNELQKLRKERLKQQIGFEAQKRERAVEQRAAECHEMKKIAFHTKMRRAHHQPKPANGPVPPVPQPETGPGDQKLAA